MVTELVTQGNVVKTAGAGTAIVDVATVFMVFAPVFPVIKPFIPGVATDSMVPAPYSGVTATSVMVNVPSIPGAEAEVAVCVAISAGNETSGTGNGASSAVNVT